MEKFIIHLPEPKQTFSIKMSKKTKKSLTEVCRITGYDQEFVIRAGISFMETQYYKKLKEVQREGNSDTEEEKREIINPYPPLVKRKKKYNNE